MEKRSPSNKEPEHLEVSFLGFKFKSTNPSSRAVIIIAMLLIFFVVLVVLLPG